MALLNRVRVDWAGSAVRGASCTTLHYDATGAAVPNVAAIKSAFAAFNTALPGGVTLTIPGSGDQIDPANGMLMSSWTASGGGTVTGTSSGTVAGPAGACITLNTVTIFDGRRVRGRLFMVPLAAIAYGADGTLDDGVRGSLVTLGNALMAAGPLVVWHRPKPTSPGTGGWAAVTSVSVRDKVAVLRSRRD